MYTDTTIHMLQAFNCNFCIAGTVNLHLYGLVRGPFLVSLGRYLVNCNTKYISTTIVLLKTQFRPQLTGMYTVKSADRTIV